MEENKQMIDPNEIHVNIKKNDTGSDLFDSDCCSVLSMVLTADGRLASSFFGLHTPEVIKAMKKITNRYYAQLLKDFKKQLKEEKARIKGIKVLKEKNPELTDEMLMQLADEFREFQRQEEINKAEEVEKNKLEKNKPAVKPKSAGAKKTNNKKSTTTKKSTTKKK